MTIVISRYAAMKSLRNRKIIIRSGWTIYSFVSLRGRTVVDDWYDTIANNKDLIGRLDAKLDLLEKHGSELPTGLLAGTRFRHIDKLRIFGCGQVWRIMICKGPINNDVEFTILLAAREMDRKLIPPDADKLADDNRKIIIANPMRRKRHERNRQ